jgi:hypothetical protein
VQDEGFLTQTGTSWKRTRLLAQEAQNDWAADKQNRKRQAMWASWSILGFQQRRIDGKWNHDGVEFRVYGMQLFLKCRGLMFPLFFGWRDRWCCVMGY